MELFHWLLIFWFVLAAVSFVALLFFTAPYGRHTRKGWGPLINGRLGWVLMELPSPLVFALAFLLGHNTPGLVAWLLLGLWQLHYIQRTFIFPFLMRGQANQITLVTVALAIVFNLGNAYLNGWYLFTLAPPYPLSWLMDPRFIVGIALFMTGWAINLHSDHILRHLRKPGEKSYAIPHGGAFKLVSCANYLGEVIEWTGWAIATWSLPGLAFALWTAANLVPRAWSHHRWYRSHFPDYPPRRKAIIPFLL